jgi:hypothetical protein
MANRITLIPTINQEDAILYNMIGLLAGFFKPGEGAESWGSYCLIISDKNRKLIGEVWLNEDISDYLSTETLNSYLNQGSFSEVELLNEYINCGVITEDTQGISMVHTGNPRQRELIKFLQIYFNAFYFDEGNSDIIGPGYEWDRRPRIIKYADRKSKESIKKLSSLVKKIIKSPNFSKTIISGFNWRNIKSLLHQKIFKMRK